MVKSFLVREATTIDGKKVKIKVSFDVSESELNSRIEKIDDNIKETKKLINSLESQLSSLYKEKEDKINFINNINK